ncbi:MAG: hypothetical protein RLZZ524_1325 [Pseudomonadota bacterium]
MSADAVLEAVALLNPRTMARAQRLASAVSMIRSGVEQREASVLIRERFGCDRWTAWRVVSMAVDMAAPIEPAAEAPK